jgi:hypothetical protein
MIFFKILLHFILVFFLTLLTQTGGIVYLVHFSLYPYINKRLQNDFAKRTTKFSCFILLYLLTTFLIIPPIARVFGRTPLPYTASNHVQPLNFITCLLNRNYARPQLKSVFFEVAQKMNEKYPGTTLNYLDANFPFMNGFPLMPHLSHNDGRKLDISFCYNSSKTGLPVNNTPSPIGYGICEEPVPNEKDMSAYCAQRGYWQYNLLRKIVPQDYKKGFIFNAQKTRDLVNYFASENVVEKIFIEPHLKTRLAIVNQKVRFQGCRAVRHDDHIHLQIK